MVQPRAAPGADLPLFVFGGPYSNLQATQAALSEAQRRGFPAERIVCTGDVAAYGADAAATVAVIREAGIQVVRGNCEESLASGAADCGCGFSPGSLCDRLASDWFRHADTCLDDDARRWMAQLPARLDFNLGGRRLAVIHGGARRINDFIFASTPAAQKLAELEVLGADGVIAGHCGLPFTQIVEGRLWHNAGAIGMPAHDGTPRVWFSILTPRADGLHIEHHAMDYDHAGAADSMRRAGLPEAYATALATGIWPSCDVLPADEIRRAGRPLAPGTAVWPAGAPQAAPKRRQPVLAHLWPVAAPDPREQAKFRDPQVTADGQRRAQVPLRALETVWFNTGTLCNLACRHCYIESTPRNDRLAYLTREDVTFYLDEIARENFPVREIGFTGGEPFMNPDIIDLLGDTLARGHRALVLTNAMRPMARHREALLELRRRYADRLTLRVSLDHYAAPRHEEERGPRSYQPTLNGLIWLARNGFDISVAGRTMWAEDDASTRAGFARLFAEHNIGIDAFDPARLVLFPEMDADAPVPEITESCWAILGKSPDSLMCASARMVVRRKGAAAPSVLACTLLAYDTQFELGHTLRAADRSVALNHRHCATFCVLGGASCSAKPAQDAPVNLPAEVAAVG